MMRVLAVVLKKDGSEAGFSLLETVLALALLGLISVPLLGFFGKTIDYLSVNDTREKAVLIARDRVEEIKAADFAVLENEEEKFTPVSPAGYPEYERTVEIVTESEGALKEVIVTVYWNSRNEQITIKTRIIDR